MELLLVEVGAEDGPESDIKEEPERVLTLRMGIVIGQIGQNKEAN